MRRLGQGMVVAFPDGDPMSTVGVYGQATSSYWNMLFNNVGTERWHWSMRHGVQL